MKTIRVHHVVLLISIALVVVLNTMIEHVWTKRNYEFLPEMVYSAPVNAQSERWYEAMRDRDMNPAPGAVARTPWASGLPYRPMEALASTDSAVQAWTPGAIDRGRDMYMVFCAPCHGAGGAGDGEIAKRGYPPPPSLLAEQALALSDQEMFNIIRDGKGTMPDYRSQLSPEDMWKSVLYMRVLQADAHNAGDREQ